jgi:hypothetical protein
LRQIHVGHVKVVAKIEFLLLGTGTRGGFSLACVVDTVNCNRRSNKDGEQQRCCGRAKARDGGVTPAPSPKFFHLGRATGLDGLII